MTHRFINWALALAIVATFAGIQQLDAADFEEEIAAERREWMHAVQHCHRSFGPATAPEYNDAGRLVCVSRRGEVLATVQGEKR